MSQPSRILIGLIAGLATGIAASIVENPIVTRAITAIQPIGALWINALQMTVIPLVLSLLVGSVGSATVLGKFGRIAGRALLMFLLLYVAVAAAALVAPPPLLSWLSVTPGARGAIAGGPTTGPAGNVGGVSMGEQLTQVIPVNPFRAAANGDILPLFIFFILFALALTRVDPIARDTVVRLFKGVGDAMLVLVGWILVVAPFGIFAVVAPLTARMGFGALGALTYYVVLLSALCLLFTLPLYLLASYLGHVSIVQFGRAVAPSQAVALSTQSSLASLPTMIEGAEARLGAQPQVVGVVLPLAVSVFRYSTPIWLIVAALFVARLSGIDLALSQMITVAGLSVLMSVAGVGLPSGASYFGPITPVFLSVGLPVETIAILFAVDTIPDMIETVTNVTADMATVVAVSGPSVQSDPSLAGASASTRTFTTMAREANPGGQM
jgi:Na+/H+-dicarboxylate symporter